MSNTLISPCLDNLTHQERLQDRLEWEGYTEVRMKSGGNCQFRALADQIYQTSDGYKRVRQEIVKQLKKHPKPYQGLVKKMAYSEYVTNMSNDSVSGDAVTLRAAADVYGVEIGVITSIKECPLIVILPKSQKEQEKVIYLSYKQGVHYNSVYLNQGLDTASIELLKKKKNKNKENYEKEKEKEESEEKERDEKREEKRKEKEEKRKKKEKKNSKEKKKNNNKSYDQFRVSDVMSCECLFFFG